MIIKPTKIQYNWQEDERIMFLHLDPATWQNREYDNHSTPLNEINPTLLDTDQWCAAAKSFGAKTIIYVAKHCGGFCWWQTNTSEYSIKNTPWRNGTGDVLKDISNSCSKYGLKLGVYVYPGDDTWGAFMGAGGRTSDPSKQAAYNEIHRQQLTEVLSNYGDISEVWFDGSSIIPVGDILEKYAPNAVIFQGPHASIRWSGTESGEVPYPNWYTVDLEKLKSGVSTAFDSIPDGDAWAPVEINTPLYDHYWFWSKEKESSRKSLDQLMLFYYKSVGRGGNLLLNACPTTTGLICDDDMTRYKEFGDEIERRFSTPLGTTTVADSYAEIDLGYNQPINHVISMEDYSQGQTIRKYVIEGFCDDNWITLITGESIGRKRIDVFETIMTSKIRIRIIESSGPVNLKNLLAYNVTQVDISKLIKAVYPSNTSAKWTKICNWDTSNQINLDIDLSLFIDEAYQYNVKFLPDNASVSSKSIITEVELFFEGQHVPEMLTICDDQTYTYNINRTAVTLGEGDESTILKTKFSTESISTGEVYICKRI